MILNSYRYEGGEAWSPSDLTGLSGWYDPSDSGTITESGGAVSQIDDKSGGANHLAQGTGANQPTTGTRTQNSLNVLDFDGTDYMNYGTFPVNSSGDLTIMGVFIIDVINHQSDSIFSMDATNDFQIASDNASQFDGSIVVSGIGTSAAWSGGPYSGVILAEVVFDYGATYKAFVDGSEVASGTYTGTKLDTSQDFKVMVQRGTSRFVDGAMGELLVFDEVDASSRSSARTYLADKWGITL